MKKSLIEISRPETKSFSGYAELADHLKAVNNASEWTIVRSEETSFNGESGANTFEAMGGDEFSCVTVSFDEDGSPVPLRYTALTSILNRCEISGDGIKKLFLSDKEYFAKHLNRYLSLKCPRSIQRHTRRSVRWMCLIWWRTICRILIMLSS